MKVREKKKTESFYILGNRRVLARVPWIPTRYHREFFLKKKISESISTGAQYVTLDNKIKCLSLAVFLAGDLELYMKKACLRYQLFTNFLLGI